MEFLLKQKIDKNNFNIFIRDLSYNLNNNLKHIIEDTINHEYESINKNKNKNNKKNKKKVIKKKDIIIAEQNNKRALIKIKDDLIKVDFLFHNKDINNPFNSIKLLKSKEGIEKMKYLLLEFYWNHKDKKQYMNYIISLYYQLKDTNNINYKNLIENIGDKLQQYEYKLYMMKELGYLLPPLNFWDNPEKKLDDWQKQVIKIVNDKESCIVKAPTSAGKTWIAMSTGIIHKKIIYVCPAKPVAYQVGSHFIHMGYKVHYLVDNLSNNSFDNKTNIFIGTPHEIENNLHKIGIHFDYAVFDEIHNLNKKEDGDIYENLIKIFKCNFLALSATIGNVEYLKEIFNNNNNNNKRIHYIEYNKRFINHQRWVYNNDKLESIHPLCSIDVDDLNDEFINNSLSFTPNDCAILWEIIEDIYDDSEEEEIIEDMSPDEYFTENKLLTLDDCLKYELFLKQFLINNKSNNNISKILNNLKIKNNSKNNKENIIPFLRECKKNDMLPMIIFNTNIEICKEIFYYIYENLAESEQKYYPFHYIILEKKQELYEKYLEDRDKFKNNIKIDKKSKDPGTDINTKLESYDRKYKEKYKNDICNFYLNCLNDIDRAEVDKEIKKIQKKNLQKEYNNFNINPDFCTQDVFKKHEDFCFTMDEPMSGDTIRDIRREIMKTLGVKISYEHPIFQMLKRGIGLYVETMPDEYKWILQKLLSQRKIGIVISDRTLCMGIDLPVRTITLMEYKGNNEFTNEDYKQMSGRAGRRGQDNKGNIIFYGNIDYLALMKGILPNIIGSDNNINTNYKILSKINTSIKSDNINNLFNNFINPNRIINNCNIQTNNNKLLWYLRNYINSNIFINKLDDIESYLFINKIDTDIYILNHIYELINKLNINTEYKSNNINDNIIEKLNIFNEIYEVVINIYNNLNKDKYLFIRKSLKIIYENIRTIIIKYNGF